MNKNEIKIMTDAIKKPTPMPYMAYRAGQKNE